MNADETRSSVELTGSSAKDVQTTGVDSGHHTAPTNSDSSSPQTQEEVVGRSESRGTNITNTTNAEDEEVASVFQNALENSKPSTPLPSGAETYGEERAFRDMSNVTSELVDPQPLPPGKCRLRPLKTKVRMQLLFSSDPSEIYLMLEMTDAMRDACGDVSQSWCFVQRLRDMMLKLYGNCEDSVAPKVDAGFLYEGMAVAAFYMDQHDDRAWYRAVVRAVDLAKDEIRVFFVDYGNTEVLSLRQIRYLHSSVAGSPVVINCCRLADFHPCEDEEGRKKQNQAFRVQMTKYVVRESNCHLVVEFVSDQIYPGDYYDVYPVRLYTRNGRALTPEVLMCEGAVPVEVAGVPSPPKVPKFAVPAVPAQSSFAASAAQGTGFARRRQPTTDTCAAANEYATSSEHSRDVSTSGQPTDRMLQMGETMHQTQQGIVECEAMIIESGDCGGRLCIDGVRDGRPVFFDMKTKIDQEGYGYAYRTLEQVQVTVGSIYSVELSDSGKPFLYCTAMKRIKECSKEALVKMAKIEAICNNYAIAMTPTSELVLLLPEAAQMPLTSILVAAGVQESQIEEMPQLSFNPPPDWLVLGGNVQMNTVPCPDFVARLNKNNRVPLVALSSQQYGPVVTGLAQVDLCLCDGYTLQLLQSNDSSDSIEDTIFLPKSVLHKFSRLRSLPPDTTVSFKACQELDNRRYNLRAIECKVLDEPTLCQQPHLVQASNEHEESESSCELLPLDHNDGGYSSGSPRIGVEHDLVDTGGPLVNEVDYVVHVGNWVAELTGRGSPAPQQRSVRRINPENARNKPKMSENVFNMPQSFACIFCDPPGPVFSSKQQLLSHIRGPDHEEEQEEQHSALAATADTTDASHENSLVQDSEEKKPHPPKKTDAFSFLVEEMIHELGRPKSVTPKLAEANC